MEKQLIKCAMELVGKWKQFFGLYTQYAGYLTADMALAIMSVWREWDGEKELTEYDATEVQHIINDYIFDYNENNPQNCRTSHYKRRNGGTAKAFMCIAEI